MLKVFRSKRASLTGNWDDSKGTKHCTVCDSKFGVTRRKYHCRVCGHIVCASCSKTRIHLPTSRSGQVKRVCDTCVPGVRAGLKTGEFLKQSETDDGLTSEEESKIPTPVSAPPPDADDDDDGDLRLLGGSSPTTAASAAAAVAATQHSVGPVVLLSREQEAEIVNDSLAEAGF